MSIEKLTDDITVIKPLECAELNLVRFKYTWVIQHKSFLDIQSPTFSPICNAKSTWYLKLIKRERNDLQACLCLLPCNLSEVTVKYSVSLLNPYGEKQMLTMPSTCKSVSSTEITEYKTTNGFHNLEISYGHNKPITIFCEIEYSAKLHRNSLKGKIKVPEPQLLDNLQHLFQTQYCSDIIFNVCGEKLLAHKGILSARSRVFSAMFEHEMAEKKENVVKVTDIELEVFKEMLRYIYTDKVPKIKTMADKLLMAAEKYELERLKIMCEDALHADLTIKNAAATLTLADLHNAEQLKLQTAEFIDLNLVEVLKTENWQSLINEHPKLMSEVLRASAKKKIPLAAA